MLADDDYEKEKGKNGEMCIYFSEGIVRDSVQSSGFASSTGRKRKVSDSGQLEGAAAEASSVHNRMSDAANASPAKHS
eukprot:11774475-Alexandrium_andersonii.AAC.1